MRIQKAVDSEVAALLDDSDLSQLGSDIEDLEEDFVVQVNLPCIAVEPSVVYSRGRETEKGKNAATATKAASTPRGY